MEVGGQSGIPAPGAGAVAPATGRKRPFFKARSLSARDVQFYRTCDDLSGPLIYSMVVFSPWAFGTTQPWSIWLMNAAGYLLGLMLSFKLFIRWFKGYRPPRWGSNLNAGLGDHKSSPKVSSPLSVVSSPSSVVRSPLSVVSSQWSTLRARYGTAACLIATLVGLTIAILGYCLISAVNARATFHGRELSFAYHPCIRWLPHSLDSGRTWMAFWTYLGLACSFWAIRDWLLGKSEVEEREERRKLRSGSDQPSPLLPGRLRRLLWVLAINGGLLGLEGIAQRLEGSGKLLFLVRPRVNPGAEDQFGPYAYRSNAAQYFNLLWPACLGFWWTLNRSQRGKAATKLLNTLSANDLWKWLIRNLRERATLFRIAVRSARRGAHHLLLLVCAIMAACPIISTSRAGALIAVGILALAGFYLLAAHFLSAAHRAPDPRTRLVTTGGLALFFAGALALGFALGWKTLKPRLAQMPEGFEVREEMYAAARPMAKDYPLFGTGPGTFETVFQLYRVSTGTYWPAQLHNDWLETRITFGWLGSGLIALAFAAVVLRWFARGGIYGGRRFIVLTWLAMTGCLVHALYDFPFQIYSILLLFLVLCAILSLLTRRPR